jgi:orotate phosphoribosyltransferase
MILDSETHDIVRGFFEAKVLQISTNPMFKLTSGKESPVYIDHRKIFSHSSLRKKVVAKWAEMLKVEFSAMLDSGNVVFAGTATAGIAPAYALAEHFNSGFVYVRSKPKQHGLNSIIEGSLPANACVFVVDDMITTGGSILQAVEYVKSESVKSIVAISISNHNLKKANDSFVAKNLACKSLFKTTDLFDIAYAKDFITGREMKMIMEWLTQLDE